MRKNMTPEELSLWLDFLKKLPTTVNRQNIIGKYIDDFFCAAGRLVIEIDGSQHRTAEGITYDNQRDAYLNSLGLKVLRISNDEIRNDFEGVCKRIKDCLPK